MDNYIFSTFHKTATRGVLAAAHFVPQTEYKRVGIRFLTEIKLQCLTDESNGNNERTIQNILDNNLNGTDLETRK
jgi:hypothetical protein